MTLLYCYDAYCGWCYGFSPVMRQLAEHYKGRLAIEVLSGGMIIAEKPQPIAVTAGYIQKAYKVVEQHTGVQFGQDYLWHIFHPDESDWYPDSLKPAVALCVFKDYYPDRQVAFAADLQYALHYEGRDLCDDEAYRHLLEKYGIRDEAFYVKLHSPEYEEQARYEFALCQQLQVAGYPALLLQTGESKFYLVAKGYTDYGAVQGRIDAILEEVGGVGSNG
jgi:putative protein-disulfide isomerase